MDAIPQRTRVGAYVVCVRDGQVLLVRFGDGGRWTLPGGGIDHGEEPGAAAIREVEEETGYRVRLGPVIALHSTRWDRAHDGSPIDLHAVGIIFAGEVAGGELRAEPDGATETPEWVPLADVPARDRTNLIDIGLAASR